MLLRTYLEEILRSLPLQQACIFVTNSLSKMVRVLFFSCFTLFYTYLIDLVSAHSLVFSFFDILYGKSVNWFFLFFTFLTCPERFAWNGGDISYFNGCLACLEISRISVRNQYVFFASHFSSCSFHGHSLFYSFPIRAFSLCCICAMCYSDPFLLLRSCWFVDFLFADCMSVCM